MTMIKKDEKPRQSLISSSNYPKLNIEKIAMVSRDYNKKDENGIKDFSNSFENILLYLDEQACDSIVFSLYTLVKRDSFDVIQILNNIDLKNIKSIFIEEFIDDNPERKACENVVYYKSTDNWKAYKYTQKFGTLSYTQTFERETIEPFKKEVKEQRNFGNSTVLLCGETNIVKYSQKNKKVEDKFDFFSSLDDDIKIIINPIHDKMIRFEMKLKREYLSRNKRYVISVWNKGKKDKNGKTRDGDKSPWTVYYDGYEKIIQQISHNISNNIDLQIGILDTKNFNMEKN